MSDIAEEGLRVTVSGAEYTIPPPFTNRELHLIKQIAGVRAGEIFDALRTGDQDLLVAMAHIALRRAGAPRPTVEELWDLPATALSLVIPEDDEPDPTPAGDGDDAAGSPAILPSSPGSQPTVTSST